MFYDPYEEDDASEFDRQFLCLALCILAVFVAVLAGLFWGMI